MQKSKTKIRIAWFSPLNLEGADSSSAAAYFTDLVLPRLSERFEVELFYDGLKSFKKLYTHNYLNAYHRHKDQPFDIFFYHLEDHVRTNFVRSHLGLIPGIVFFHDYLLSTYGPEPLLNSPYRAIVDRFIDNTGTWPARDAKHERIGVFAQRESSLSAVSIFSNERTFGEWQRNKERSIGDALEWHGLKGFYLPYPVSKNCYSQGIPVTFHLPTTVLFCGSPRIEHRAHKLLLALSQDRSFKLRWLVEQHEMQEVRKLLAEFKIDNCEIITDRSPAKWGKLVREGGVAVHTLFSVFGQPAPYLSISLMAGLPCIVTNFGSTEFLPDNIVFKIQAGDTEAAEILGVLTSIRQNRVSLAPRNIHEYAREVYDVESIAAQLGLIFEHTYPFLQRIGEKWNELQITARRALRQESRQLFASKDSLSHLPEFDSLLSPTFEEFGWL